MRSLLTNSLVRIELHYVAETLKWSVVVWTLVVTLSHHRHHVTDHCDTVRTRSARDKAFKIRHVLRNVDGRFTDSSQNLVIDISM